MRRTAGTLILLLLVICAGPRANAQEDPLPQIFNGNVVIVNPPNQAGGGTSSARLRMIIDAWSTDEQRLGFAKALEAGGTEGLYQALEESTVGYLQVEQGLRWPVRIASRFQVDGGVKIRLVTNRPIHIQESRHLTRSLEYPIGVVEFVMPEGGKPGKGALLAATRAEFTEQGQLQIQSMPHQTGAQEVNNIRPEKPKKDNKQDKKKGE